MDSHFRVGIGQDSHKIRFQVKKPLFLGGVVVDRNIEVEANSDGDVILHALFNALSSAIGGDSLGVYADELCLKKGIKDSKEYIKVIMEKVLRTGFKVNNISISVEAKKPKVNLKKIDQMKKTIGKLLSIPQNCVGITFTSGEELTSFGKGEGIQVLAMVSLVKNEKT